MTFTAIERNLVRSLETISAYCEKYPLRVKRMDVSISSDNRLFTVICALSHRDTPFPPAAKTGNEKIPLAFGYRIDVPPALPQILVTSKTDQEPSIVGSIRDSGGQIIFYRDSSDGKIKISGNQ